MPRSNRPRRSQRRATRGAEGAEYDIERALFGGRRTETRGGRLWNVQQVAASAASKHYTCPGCGLGVAPGTAHVVAWRADGIMGEADDVAARRHWHSQCWRIS